MRYSVVIPTRARPASLARALQAWKAVEYDPHAYEIIVVDDAYSDDERITAPTGPSAGSNVHYVVSGGIGAAAARNLGAERAVGEILILSDDDIVVAPSHLKSQDETRRLCGSHCVASSSWRFPPSVEARLQRTSFGRFLIGAAHAGHRAVDREHLAESCFTVAVADTANLSLRTVDFHELGGFQGFADGQRPSIGALEDCILGHRAGALGLPLVRNYHSEVESYEENVTLRQVCAREVGVGASYVAARRLYPQFVEELELERDNGFVTRSDGPIRRIKKLIRGGLASSRLSALWFALAVLGERLGVPDRLLHPYFTRVIGLFALRGVRSAQREMGDDVL